MSAYTYFGVIFISYSNFLSL